MDKKRCLICYKFFEINEKEKIYCSLKCRTINTEYHKNYYKNNKDKIFFNHYNKMRTDLNYKIKSYLRVRIYNALKHNYKSAKTMKLIGCSIEYLKLYLQNQFKEGMTWKNYGQWHIDHIKPCCSFNLSKKNEQYKCFNFKNLQPLWAWENYHKRIEDNKLRIKKFDIYY